MKYLLLFLYFFIPLQALYLDNHSCKECHEKIYDEFQASYHNKGYFNDELHRKIANKADDKKYDCAVCHMPSANNLKDLMNGKARPNRDNKTHTDNISCFFCHQIAYVKKSHKYKTNVLTRQVKGFKPTLYGTLDNPESSDKHSSIKNPIYTKNVCLGCHSYKLNDYNQSIFKAVKNKQNSQDCVDCHMPYVEGGVDKYDKKARNRHISHKFLGIHDKKFRKKGIDIIASYQDNILKISLKNKMAHPLIIQPARVKYVHIIIKRDDKIIWQNFIDNPSDDKKALFSYTFLGKNKNKIIIPNKAWYYDYYNNIDQDETRVLKYINLDLKKDDKVVVSLNVIFAKKECSKVVNLKSLDLKKSHLVKQYIYTIKKSSSKL